MKWLIRAALVWRLSDPDGYIEKFVEKPASMDDRLAVIGMYYFTDGPALMRACDELMDKGIQTKGEYLPD